MEAQNTHAHTYTKVKHTSGQKMSDKVKME